MTRRRLFHLLALGASGFALDRLLWVPGQTTYFLPTPTLLTPVGLTHEALHYLAASLAHAQRMERSYDRLFHVGDRLHVALPPRFRPAP